MLALVEQLDVLGRQAVVVVVAGGLHMGQVHVQAQVVNRLDGFIAPALAAHADATENFFSLRLQHDAVARIAGHVDRHAFVAHHPRAQGHGKAAVLCADAVGVARAGEVTHDVVGNAVGRHAALAAAAFHTDLAVHARQAGAGHIALHIAVQGAGVDRLVAARLGLHRFPVEYRCACADGQHQPQYGCVS